MKIITSLFKGVALFAMFFAVSASGSVPNTMNVTAYAAIAPAYGSAGYNSFLINMAQNMLAQGSAGIGPSGSLTPIPFLAPGSIVSATNVFTYPDKSGSQLLSGVVVDSTNLFYANLLTCTLTSPVWVFSNNFNGLSFSPWVIGVKHTDGGDVFYTSGSAASIAVNAVAFPAQAFNFNVNTGQSLPAARASFMASFNGLNDVPIVNSYSIGGVTASITTTFQAFPVPEPSSGAMLVLAATATSLLRLRRKR